jgi:hypothetical protein
MLNNVLWQPTQEHNEAFYVKGTDMSFMAKLADCDCVSAR